MVKLTYFISGVIIALLVSIVISGYNTNKLLRVIKAQDALIERAKSELEYQTGDYQFCDGDEYQEVIAAKNEL